MTNRNSATEWMTRKFRHWRFRLRFAAARWRRACLYAQERLTADDAQQVMIDCEFPAGWFPLLTLTVEDTLEQTFEEYHDHPDLRRLMTHACARVGKKWENNGDELYYARRWAIELAADYARDEGIVLIRRAADDETGNAASEATSERGAS